MSGKRDANSHAERQLLIDITTTKTAGNKAWPSECPRNTTEIARPLFARNHLPTATAGICVSIPCPKKRRPQMITGRSQAALETAMAQHIPASPTITKAASFRTFIRSANGPTIIIMAAEANVPMVYALPQSLWERLNSARISPANTEIKNV